MNRALRRCAAFLVLALAVAAPWSPAAADPYTWDLSTVDPAGNSGNSLALRVEPAGIGHVAFWTIGVGVRYGVRAGGSWTLETLPDAGAPPAGPGAGATESPAPPEESQLLQHTSVNLALAPDGTPWIAEVDHGSLSSHSNAGPLAVRHREAGAWVTEWLGVAGTGASLEIDAAGGVHAAWGTTSGDVLYARRTGPNAWTSEVAFPSSSGGRPAGMKVGGDGSVHFAVRDVDGIVRLVVRAPGGGWTATPVTGPVIFGIIWPSDLALDAQDRPLVVTHERDPLYPRAHLRLHRFDGTAWTHEDVDVDQTPKSGGVLALDGFGNPVVAYHRSAENRFVVAAPGPSAWAWAVVDSVGNGNQGVGGAFDAIGRPWFANATQSVGVRLAIGQHTVGIPAAPAMDGAWLGALRPQPARGGTEMSLAVRARAAGAMTFETVDARGAVRRRDVRAVEAGAGTVRLSTRGLAPGVYWIRARDAAGREGARRFVVTP